MWNEYIEPNSIEEALAALARRGNQARIIAGATDLILELERGVRSGINTLIDISRIPDLDSIHQDENGVIHLGPLVTHNDCVVSMILRDSAYPLARAAWEVGAPQIRNRGTVAGNIITASPANDTIPPLMALGATVTLRSVRGERKVNLAGFYKGVRSTVMGADEMLVDIAFPAMSNGQQGTFVKLALRRTQSISLVNAAIVIALQDKVITSVAIALGAVAPTIIRAIEAEAYLTGKILDDTTIGDASRLAATASRPIDDIRGSATYRREMVRVITARGLRALREKSERADFPAAPVLLWGQNSGPRSTNLQSDPRKVNKGNSLVFSAGVPIETIINGKQFTFRTGHEKTLLRLLREDAGLTGTKEGCAEGECGACTVYLDGKAVMSCLIPAPRAHHADIVTIEGLAQNSRLHPLQNAFIENSAVQCGYCTPGFIMSGAKLLEEKPHPTKQDILQALTGNLCRCTGYFNIIRAVEDASQEHA